MCGNAEGGIVDFITVYIGTGGPMFAVESLCLPVLFLYGSLLFFPFV